MGSKSIEIRPVAVALRGEEGSVALFACEMPADEAGRVSVWATCGQRRRFPIPARVTSDTTDEARHVVLEAILPAEYTACTIHVRVGTGPLAKRAACRIPHEQFRALAPVVESPENDERYHDWFVAQRATAEELQQQRQHVFKLQPLISIVTPLFKTPRAFLKDFIDSVLAQTYANFELILVNVSGPCADVDETLATYDDDRIRVITAPNLSIPENTNPGIAVARGDYVGFIDHDDFIEPDAFFRYVETINDHPQCDLLFCDEDMWDMSTKRFVGARFKLNWNPDLLYSHNYVCHLLMVSRHVLDNTQRSDAAVNGAQDYDLTLKAAEVARTICHVPGILYHWRRHPQSTASNRESKPYALEAGRIAIQSHFDRLGVKARTAPESDAFTYRPHFVRSSHESTSLILTNVPVKGLSDYKEQCRIGTNDVEIIVQGASESLNAAVSRSQGEAIVLLDASATAVGIDLLDALLEQLHAPKAGCCAPVLVNDDGLVKSCGLVYGKDGVWRHALRDYPARDAGYLFMLDYTHDVFAVPATCIAFWRESFNLVDGFDSSLDSHWAAVDFCLRLRDKGLLTAIVPYVPLAVKGDMQDLQSEALAKVLAKQHPCIADGDPYLNPCLDQTSRNYTLAC